MNEDTFRTVLVVIIICAIIALLAITADVMTKHPSIPWFIAGMAALAGAEVIGYLIFRLIKHFRK